MDQWEQMARSHRDNNSNGNYHYLSIYGVQASGQANHIVSHLILKIILWRRNYCPHLLMEEA